MKVTFLSVLILALFGCGQSSGQQKTTPKSVAVQPTSVASVTFQTITEKSYPDLYPGDRAPDAVIIDADYINAILNGVCIITKGKLQAMIDVKGNFICPYGKYTYLKPEPFSPLIAVSDQSSQSGYINLKGEVVIPLQYVRADNFDCHRIAAVGTKSSFYDRINSKGHKLPDMLRSSIFSLYQREPYDREQSPLIVFQDGRSCGYMDKTGKVVIPAQFEKAAEFTDGLAAVMKTDQFGAIRWGFINLRGELVIPYTFQVQPGQFHNGLALVAPVQRTTFNYEYIDKTGKIKRTVGNGRDFTAPYPAGIIGKAANTINGSFFINGYAVWDFGDGNLYKLLDTAGQFHTIGDIIQTPQIARNKDEFIFDDYDDLGLYFHVSDKAIIRNNHGIMDYQGNLIFPPAFNQIRPDFRSPYAIAQRMLPDNPNNTPNSVTGIINRAGVYILVLDKKPTF